MRDPRFGWDWAGLHADRQKTEAAALLNTFSDITPVRSAIEQWWLEEAANVAGDLDVTAACARMQAALVGIDQLYDPLTSSLGLALTLTTPETAATSAARSLLGQTLAKSVLRTPGSATIFDLAAGILRRWWPALDSFKEAFIADIQPKLIGDWVKALRAIPSDLPSLMGFYNHRGPSPFQHLEEVENRRRQRGLIAHLKDALDPRVQLKDKWVTRANLLLALDAATFVDLVESLPLRELRRSLMNSVRLFEDREALLECLEMSRPMFEGDAWTGQTLALDVLHLTVLHAERLYTTIAEAARPSGPGMATLPIQTLASADLPIATAELGRFLKAAVKSVASRSDGRPLAIYFAVGLLRTGIDSSRRRRTALPFSPADLALSSIRTTFAPPLVPDELQAAVALGVPAQETHANQALFCQAAAVLQLSPAKTWEWYVRLLLAHDEEFCAQVRSGAPAWLLAGLGGALLLLADPLNSWRAAWRDLYPLRTLFRFDERLTSALLPNVHLIQAGFGVFNRSDWTARIGARPAQALWHELRGAVVSLHQGIARARHFIPSGYVALGFEHAPALFGSGWVGLLGESLAWLHTDLEHPLYVAEALQAGGVQRDNVFREMASRGCDLQEAATQASRAKPMDDRLAVACHRLGLM